MTDKKLSKPLKFKSFITRNVHHTKAELPQEGTLYNAILRIARNFLETREKIKILTHPFYHINFG